MHLQRMDQNLALVYDFARLWWNLYSSGYLFLNCGNRVIASNVRFVKSEPTVWKRVLKVYKDFLQMWLVFKLCTRNPVKMKGLSVFSPSLPPPAFLPELACLKCLQHLKGLSS